MFDDTVSPPEQPSAYQHCSACNTGFFRHTVEPRRHRVLFIPLWWLGGKPESYEKRHFCWQMWRRSTTRTHWVLSVLALIFALGFNYLLIIEFPLLRLSILKLWFIVAGLFTGQSVHDALLRQINPGPMSESTTHIVAPILIAVGLLFLVMFRLIWQRLPELVLQEEQTFREGAERWTSVKRVRMALYFGLAHLSNIWYPLSACLTIAVFGLVLNGLYRYHHFRSGRDVAMREVTMLHLTYDYLAFQLLRVMSVAMIGFGIITIAFG